MHNNIQDEIIKLNKNKDIILKHKVEEIQNSKSKYSTFGGDTATCSIEVPKYLKQIKI